MRRGTFAMGLTATLVLFAGSVHADVTPAGAQEAAAITITPDEELIDGQAVTVSGTGFLGDSTVYIVPCPAGATTPAECDISPVPAGVPTDASGSFTADYVAQRLIQGQVGGVPTDLDCAVDSCVLGVGDIDLRADCVRAHRLRRRALPQPAITVTPSDGLDDGDVVQVVGTGFAAGREIEVVQCAPGASAFASCDSTVSKQPVQTDSTGFVHHRVPGGTRGCRPRVAGPVQLVDCASSTCLLAAGRLGEPGTAFHALGFDDLPLPEPSFTVTPNRRHIRCRSSHRQRSTA